MPIGVALILREIKKQQQHHSKFLKYLTENKNKKTSRYRSRQLFKLKYKLIYCEII